MIYNRKNEVVYINHKEIWSFFKDKFGLNESGIQSLTQEWLYEVYNLRGITTGTSTSLGYRGWMRSTI